VPEQGGEKNYPNTHLMML